MIEKKKQEFQAGKQKAFFSAKTNIFDLDHDLPDSHYLQPARLFLFTLYILFYSIYSAVR